MFIFLVCAAILSVLYYIIIVIDSGVSATFSPFWLLLGTVFGAAAAVVRMMKKRRLKWPKGIMIVLGIFFVVGICVFAVVEALLISSAAKTAPDGGDYVIVLGAQVRGDVPSRILRKRIETAAEYLKRNPQAKVIASGGQGPGEDISEAQCIASVLEDLGIEPERIFKEDASTDTYENIQNSLALCGRDKKIVVVTCGYHMYRAKELAKAAGAVHVSGLASPEDPVLAVNYYMREFFAVIKYKLSGQI